MINVMFDKNNYLCLNESYQKTRKNMKETIAKINSLKQPKLSAKNDH